MKRFGARLVFVLLPAIGFGAPVALISPPIGLAIFAFLVMLGISATKARPERGEGIGRGDDQAVDITDGRE